MGSRKDKQNRMYRALLVSTWGNCLWSVWPYCGSFRSWGQSSDGQPVCWDGALEQLGHRSWGLRTPSCSWKLPSGPGCGLTGGKRRSSPELHLALGREHREASRGCPRASLWDSGDMGPPFPQRKLDQAWAHGWAHACALLHPLLFSVRQSWL